MVTDDYVNYDVLIRWCLDNSLIQQALTITESKMPEIFVRNGVITYYKNNITLQDMIKIINMFVDVMDNEKNIRYMFNDMNHYFIKSYSRDKYHKNKRSLYINQLISEMKLERNPSNPFSAFSNKATAITDYDIATDNRKEDKLKDLINKYYDLCEIRNQLNHAEDRVRSFYYSFLLL